MRPTLSEYYSWRMELAEYCHAMQKKGVRIDTDYVAKLEETFENKKLGIFPYTLVDSKSTSLKCRECHGLGRPKEKKPRKKTKQNKPPEPGLFDRNLAEGVNPPPSAQCASCSGSGKVTETKPCKPTKVWEGPFNPNSPKAVIKWFVDNGLVLIDRGGKPSIGKQVVLKALNKRLKPYGLEFEPKLGDVKSYSDEVTESTPDLDSVTEMLLRLAQKQNAGKGLKSWFDARYVHNKRANPRFNPCGSSMSRLSSGNPNFQNIPRVGFGAEVRKAIIAEEGCVVVKADLSQLEFRCCLWHAGVNPDEADGAFDQLVVQSEGRFKQAAERLGWTERDVAKSAIHGGDYLEGLKLYSKNDLDDPRVMGDRAAKALIIYDGYDYPEWKFRGKYVCFTGGNLSERLFGDRTRANRRKALEIQETYIKAYPQIRDMQRGVASQIENRDEAVLYLPSGHMLRFYNRNDEDDLKQAAAYTGQGTGAVYAQEGCIAFKKLGRIANMQAHDELVFCDIPASWTDDMILSFMAPMVQESKFMKGFRCPAKVAVGPNWKEMRVLGTIR